MSIQGSQGVRWNYSALALQRVPGTLREAGFLFPPCDLELAVLEPQAWLPFEVEPALAAPTWGR